MASTNRMYRNNSGQMLIPMNVDGGTWNDHFFTSTKLVITVILGFFDGGVIAWTIQSYIDMPFNILIYLFLVYISQLVIRYFILEEKYYYRMYKKMQVFDISTPSVFWNIAMLKDTEEGGVMVYADGKVGILVRIERDTITGKQESFKETHFDAISDFYRELNLKNLNYIIMNIMEPAGQDPRIPKLDELVIKCSGNQNLAKIVESQIGYIKQITRATLFESDYILVYATDMNRSDTIISDTIDCIYHLLDGGFVGYTILNTNEILEMVKQEYGVRYFDYTEANVNMYKNNGLNISNALTISGIQFNDGIKEDVDELGNRRLVTLANYVKRGVVQEGEWAVRLALKGKLINKDSNRADKGLVGFGSVVVDSNNIIDLDSEIFGYEEKEQLEKEVKALDEKQGLLEDLLYNTVDNNKRQIDLIKGNEEGERGKKEKRRRGKEKGRKNGKNSHYEFEGEKNDNIQGRKNDINNEDISEQSESLEDLLIEGWDDDDEIIDI